MSRETGIQWTDATWNPIRGCSRVSEGCRHCYAEAVAARFSGPGLPYDGLARRRLNGEPQWTGAVMVVERHIADPLRWRTRRRIFVNSMSDLFHENVADDTIALVFAVMTLAPRHTFQVLTKRPERMRAWLSDPATAHRVATIVNDPERWPQRAVGEFQINPPAWPLPNVWLGVSVENQETADERIPRLLWTPAAIRFLSCEPLLEELELAQWLGRKQCGSCGSDPCPPGLHGTASGVDWVIVGGESGPRARMCDLAWVRDVVAQCRASSVPVFVKQLGRAPVLHESGVVTWPEVDLRDSHGADMDEWPDDLRIREFPRTTP